MNADDAFSLPYGTRRMPFGQRRGAEVWPDGARLAVGVYIAIEDWRWDRQEPHLPRLTRPVPGEKLPSLSTRTAIGYGFEVGLHRMREAMAERGVRSTLWVTGVAAKAHPKVIQALAADGHEIGAHSYSQGQHMTLLDRSEQERDIELSLEALTSVTGTRPVGWVSPSAVCDLNTVELLVEAGMTYHGDLQDDELPYFVDTAAGTIVEIPYRFVGNVNDFLITPGRSANEVYSYLTEAFDAHYEESKRRPLQLVFGTHPFVSGRADTAAAFARFLDYVRDHDGVWLATYDEIARHWTERFADGYED